jgi:AAHS family 4-hydroxybenzoate transporter-like MFS transporter
VPQLTHAWNLPGPAFTTAFVWSSIGILVGALSSGPIGDRTGRKPLLLASIALFGLASLLTAYAGSLTMLAVLRFFTGVGIGGAMPGTVALTGDYTPQRWRATVIMATFTGAPIGGFLCGQVAGLVLPSFGWPGIFIVGGVVPLLIFVALLFWLPESPRFSGGEEPIDAAPDRAPPAPRCAAGAIGGGTGSRQCEPIAMLFGKSYALQTILLWIVFFCSLMNLFLFAYWLPQVLHLTGLTPAEAARASSYRDLGAIFACCISVI